MSGETDSVSPLNIEKCSAVLVDVLGTTTPISFAKDTLLPYVTKQAEEFLKSKWDDEVVKQAVKELQEGEKELDVTAATEVVKNLTEKNSDNKGLKTIQGLIYAQGYEAGEIKGQVFEDVPASLESWAKSHKVCVFSSGSADAQKHLFSHSTEGDLSQHISSFFDQEAGSKTEPETYKNIVEQLKTKPEEVLFITDDVNEAKAAKKAGLVATVVQREGNDKVPDEDVKELVVIKSFKDVTLDNSGKRKNEEANGEAEEPPSKIPKTDPVGQAAEEVKKTEETSDAEKAENKEIVEDEAMEVDSASKEDSKDKSSSKKEETDTKSDKNAEVEKPKKETSMETEEAKVEQDANKVESTEEKKEETCKKEKVKDDKEAKVEESKTEVAEKKEASSEVDSTTEKKSEEKEAKTAEANISKTDDKVDAEKVTSTEQTPESGDKAEKEKEATEEGKTVTEKENKSDIANGIEKNGVENGKEEVAVNGDAEEKVENGEEVSEKKVDDIKVKKVEEATSDSKPPVSVEA